MTSPRIVFPCTIPSARADLNRSLVALLDEAFTHSDRLSEPDYCRNWEYRVLDAWLAQVVAPDPGASPSWRHRAARHAETYLRENPDRPISVGELCLETGVPKRTLMLGFHEAFGISPGAYHRRLRLNAARRDLSRSLTSRSDGRAGGPALGLRALRPVLGGLSQPVRRDTDNDAQGVKNRWASPYNRRSLLTTAPSSSTGHGLR